MKNSWKKMLVAAAVLALCIVLSSSTSIQGRGKDYEIRPEITLPEQKTDITRFIESYERILDRLITTNERGQLNLTDNIGNISEKLESINKKLNDVLTRLGRIEKALNIDEKTTISNDNNTSLQGNKTEDN